MKKILFFLSLLVSVCSFSQTPSGSKVRYQGSWYLCKDTATLTINDTASIVYQCRDSSLYFKAQGYWLRIATVNPSTGFVRYTDTASMLSTRLKVSDTAYMVSNRLKISDTLTMLSNRLKISDTTTMLSGYLRTGNAKVGTVTSVGLVAPSFLTISNSPITSSGNITATLANQNANTFFRGPTSGSPSQPVFGAIVQADIPNIYTLYTDTAAMLSNYYNKSTSDGRYQPLENQRLSTINNVVFGTVTSYRTSTLGTIKFGNNVDSINSSSGQLTYDTKVFIFANDTSNKWINNQYGVTLGPQPAKIFLSDSIKSVGHIIGLVGRFGDTIPASAYNTTGSLLSLTAKGNSEFDNNFGATPSTGLNAEGAYVINHMTSFLGGPRKASVLSTRLGHRNSTTQSYLVDIHSTGIISGVANDYTAFTYEPFNGMYIFPASHIDSSYSVGIDKQLKIGGSLVVLDSARFASTIKNTGLTAGSAGNFVVNGGGGLFVTRTAAQVLNDIAALSMSDTTSTISTKLNVLNQLNKYTGTSNTTTVGALTSGSIGAGFTAIPNSALANSSVTVTAGTGLGGGGVVSLGGAVTLSNAGVTSIIGTSNQVIVSSSTGGVTLSLPQPIGTGNTVQFSQVNLGGSGTNISGDGTGMVQQAGSGGILWYINTAYRGKFDGSGNLMIGSITDHAGERLQITGTSYFSGAATFTSSVTATQGIFNGGTASTSYTTGTAVITGGLGVSGAVYTNGLISATSLASSSNLTVTNSISAQNIYGSANITGLGLIANSSLKINVNNVALQQLNAAGTTNYGLIGLTNSDIVTVSWNGLPISLNANTTVTGSVSSLNFIGSTATPTIANNQASSSSILARSTDVSGNVTFTATANAGSQVTVSFVNTHSVAPIVTLTSAGSQADNIVYVTSSTTGFTIYFRATPTNATSYTYNYQVIQ